MGLMNASNQFQMMMDDRLFPVRDIADAYVDDIIVGTKAKEGEDVYEKHDKDIRSVLDVLKAEILVLDKRKCKFFVDEVAFYGHVLGHGTRRPEPGKLMAIEK